MNKREQSGFSLVELAIVMAIVAILAALMLPLIGQLNDGTRAVKASDEVSRVYFAIVGTPGTTNYGYLGDVGRYPVHLMDLLRSPGLEGWNGPYLAGISVEGDNLIDAFGSPLDYFNSIALSATPDALAIISRGPDHGSTNTSPTPNIASTYAGAPSPTVAAYYSTSPNPDNVVYPPFINSPGFIRYNGVGQLSLNILNYDANPAISAYVPACPNLFEVKVTSATRPSDTWGTGVAGTTPTYSPGGAAFDLIQGIYKVQVRQATAPNAVYWDETIPVAPGSSPSRTIQVPGLDSSTTGFYTLQVANNLSSGVTIFNGSTSIGAAAAGGGSSGSLLVRGCTPLTVRNTATNEVLDSFVMPNGIAVYKKIYSTTTFTYTLTNNTQTYRYLFVYLNNLLIGEVSGWGIRKVKSFGGLKSGDTIVIKDQTGGSPIAPVVIAGSGSNTL